MGEIVRETGSYSDGRGPANKSLIQLSVFPPCCFDLRPNYGGGNEDNGDLLQKVLCTHRHTQCP